MYPVENLDAISGKTVGLPSSLVPRPSPSFPSLAVWEAEYMVKQREAGQGPGNKANSPGHR